MLSTVNNMEIPPQPPEEPSWAKLVQIFLGWIFGKAVVERR